MKRKQREKQPAAQDSREPADTGGAVELPLLGAISVAPLTQEAAQTAVKHLDAQSHAMYMHDIMADDQLIEMGSQRGLLVRFTVRMSVSTSRPEMIVVAPEFCGVDFVKRRIFREKLLLGEFLPPHRFALKGPAHAPTDLNAAGSSMEKLPEETDKGIPSLLFNLGFRAGGDYEVEITSVPVSTDKDQQETMLRGITQGGTGAAMPLSSDPDARRYQVLLETKAQNIKPPSPLPPPVATAPEENDLGPGGSVGAANGVVAAAPPRTAAPIGSPRQRAGRWLPGEVDALIRGVQAYGYLWRKILDEYSGVFHPNRTSVDLKDKWRNLVKLSKVPGKQARGLDLTEDLRTLILRLDGEHLLSPERQGLN